MHATADTGGCPAASHGWLRIKTGGCNGHIDAASRAGILMHLDTAATAQIVRDDCVINEAFHAFVRTLITYMKEDTQMISTGLDYLSAAKAIERIGDHATNLAEFTIYIVKGTDVRHISP